jgi:hypothetical protein
MRVKIELQGTETQEEADELLLKALLGKKEASITHDSFQDPKVEKIAQKMLKLFETTQEQMLKEIEGLFNGDK